MGVICVLPARLSSTRIANKPLQEIAGRTLIEWCWRAASGIPAFDRVVVATDSEEIERRARGFQAETLRTRRDHASGTDRVDEAADILGVPDDDLVVNFQADEPFVDPGTVERAVGALSSEAPAAGAGVSGPEAPDIATVAAPIRDHDEWASAGIAKVARAEDGRALYFSRSPIPFCRDEAPVFAAAGADSGAPGNITGGGVHGEGLSAGQESPWLRHIGIYVCRRSTLRRWAALPESRLEQIEKLEQLRALEAGMRIHVEVGPWTEPGIDLPADIERAERLLSRG